MSCIVGARAVYGTSNWGLSWKSCLNMDMEVVSCMNTCNDSCGQRLMQVAAIFAREVFMKGQSPKMSSRMDQPQN